MKRHFIQLGKDQLCVFIEGDSIAPFSHCQPEDFEDDSMDDYETLSVKEVFTKFMEEEVPEGVKTVEEMVDFFKENKYDVTTFQNTH